mgnify:CR=1 FL=1
MSQRTKPPPRKPTGFTWAKFFSGDEPRGIKSLYHHLLARYKYNPLAECHSKYVDTKGKWLLNGRITDDCPIELHELAIQFCHALKHGDEPWQEAKVIYKQIKDFDCP